MPPKKSRLQKQKPKVIPDVGCKEVSVFSDAMRDTHVIETNNITDHYLVRDQDEEYELAVIMDTIRMQEEEEKHKLEILEKERQSSITIRDYHIKEILRKLKINPSKLTPFETFLISTLETFMETQELYLIINDKEYYDNIRNYLGLSNNKGIIRLSDETKIFARDTFKLIV